MVGLHLLIRMIKQKITKSGSDTVGEIFFRVLGIDLATPFRTTYLFVLIILRKHIIQDDSRLHNFMDFMEI